MSPASLRWLAGAAVLLHGLGAPARAEPLDFDPLTLEQQLLISVGRAHWIARGHFDWSDEPPRDRTLHEGAAFHDVVFTVDEILFGPETDRRLPLRVSAYPPAESSPPWWSRLFAPGLRALDGELRALEARLAAHELTRAEYHAQRGEVRQAILESPAYREGRHRLIRVQVDNGCGDPFRAADVLVERGEPVLLVTDTDPALGIGPTTLFSWLLDLHPASQSLPSAEALAPIRNDWRHLMELNALARAELVFVGVVESGSATHTAPAPAPSWERGADRVRYRVAAVLRGDLDDAATIEVHHPVVGADTVLRCVPAEQLSPGEQLIVAASRRRDAWMASEFAIFPRLASPREVERLRELIRDLNVVRD